MIPSWLLLTLLLPTLGLGCHTVEYKDLNGVKTLTEHPEFPRAAQSAPTWTREALRKVAELEFEIERR